METWEQREPGFWVSNFGNMSLEPPPGWQAPAPVAIGTPYTPPAPKPWWETQEAFEGDASGVGSQRSAINPATGKAESLVGVRARGPDGVYGEISLVPYSEYQRMAAADPNVQITQLPKAPGTEMIDQGAWADIGDAIKATAPFAAGMVLPGILSPYLSSAFGTSPLVSNALASGATSALTGGNPIQGALSSLAMGAFGGTPTGTDFSGLDVNPSGGLPGGAEAFPYQVAGGGYGGNTTMTDVMPTAGVDMTGFQTPYTPPAFGQDGLDTSAWQVPSNTNPLVDIASASGTLPYSGVQPFANIDPGPFGQNGVVVTPGATAPTGGATGGGSTLPLLGAAAGVGLAGAAGVAGGTGGTVTSGGDVDLTGVGTEPNPYNNMSWTVPDWLKGLGINSLGDLAKIAGNAAPGLISALGSSNLASGQLALANEFKQFGAPSRARYEASMTSGFDPMSIPGYAGALESTSDTLLRRLSATGGNPYGNPGGLIEANKAIVSGTALPAIQNYQNQNANTGGLGALASAWPAATTAANNARGDVYSDLGSAFRSATNPTGDIDYILKRIAAKSLTSGASGLV